MNEDFIMKCHLGPAGHFTYTLTNYHVIVWVCVGVCSNDRKSSIVLRAHPAGRLRHDSLRLCQQKYLWANIAKTFHGLFRICAGAAAAMHARP